MRKNIFFCLLLIAVDASSQFAFKNIDSIDVNNINAAMGVHGNVWLKPDSSAPSCEFPKGSGKHIAFAGGLWIGAYQQNLLKVAAQSLSLDQIDYWPGPIINAAMQPSITYAQSQNWARVWKVSRGEINMFLSQSVHTVANTPTSILEWPGQGNGYAKGNGGAILFSPMSDYSRPFAPFVDVNNNGVYEPLAGDYPKIIGDQAIWTIFNDKGPDKKRLTQTEPLGVEVRCLAYAYSRNTLVDNVIFYEYEITNRLWYSYDSVSIGFFADLDLGDPYDEYVGYDSGRNLAITYNADVNDSSGDLNSYGTHIPLAGVQLLDMPGGGCGNFRPASSFMAFNGAGAGFPSQFLDPTTGVEFYNYMNARLRDGQPLSNGGKYIATGDPSDPAGNSECANKNLKGDRRMILSSKMDSAFKPGQTIKFVIALVASDPAPGNACPGLTFAPIQEVADTALNVYCNPLAPLLTSIGSSNNLRYNVYPNPANDRLYVNFDKANQYTVVISDMTGKKLLSGSGYREQFVLNTALLPKGVYLLQVQSPTEKQITRFVKN